MRTATSTPDVEDAVKSSALAGRLLTNKVFFVESLIEGEMAVQQFRNGVANVRFDRHTSQHNRWANNQAAGLERHVPHRIDEHTVPRYGDGEIDTYQEVLFVHPNSTCSVRSPNRNTFLKDSKLERPFSFLEGESVTMSPDDPLYQYQWNLHGTYGIDAPDAWDVTTGSSTTFISFTDDYLDPNHPDYSSRPQSLSSTGTCPMQTWLRESESLNSTTTKE